MAADPVTPVRILVAMPHCARPGGSGPYGSLGSDAAPRLAALREAVWALNRHFGADQRVAQVMSLRDVAVNNSLRASVDVVVCTSGPHHLLGGLDLPEWMYAHRPTDCEPMLLGYECHRVLAERLGEYDWYCYLEDDLVVHDPLFFAKLAWFTGQAGDGAVLLPHRYEVSPLRRPHKFYIDGDNPTYHVDPAAIDGRMEARGLALGLDLGFRAALNPHSGCFFLNARQMARWAASPLFLDRDTAFIGPLESAATLGLIRHFVVFKPAFEQAAFLEIQHWGDKFLSGGGSH